MTKKSKQLAQKHRKTRPKKSKIVPLKTSSTTIYWPDHLDEVRAIAARGLDEAEMAAFLGITPALYESWKAYYPRFEEAIEQGRTNADAQVVAALFKNAIGYSYTRDVVVRGRKGAMVLQVKEHVPGETNAQKFWLSNRAPDKWGEKTSVNLGSKPGNPVLVKQETKEEVIHSILNMIQPLPDGGK